MDTRGLDNRMGRFETRMDSIDRTQHAILTTVQSIDGQLNGSRDHQERIERLEDEVFAPRKPQQHAA